MNSPILEVATVTAPAHGTLTRWYVANGAAVLKGAQLGIFVNGNGIQALQASAPGSVSLVVREGQNVSSGQLLATVEPLPPAPPVPAREATRRPLSASPVRTSNDTRAPRKNAQRLNGEARQPVETPAAPRRTGGAGVMELTLPAPRKRTTRKPKIVKWTVHPTNVQKATFQGLAARMGERYGYASSELQRAMFDLFLSLPEREIIERVEAQRDIEQAEQFGFGNRPSS